MTPTQTKKRLFLIGPSIRLGIYGRGACAAAMTLLLTACASNAIDRAPRSPNTAWQADSAAQPASASENLGPTGRNEGFSIPPVAALGQLATGIDIDLEKTHSLPELIDIAQRGHPDTRLAWNRARQAALAVGMVEATFLPMLSANVVGGYQRTRYPLPENITGIRDIKTELSGVVPALTLGWLLFDFGQRKALYDAASELSFAQNVLFNAAHQKIIRDVTDQFYQYNTARTHSALSASMLVNQQKVLAAVTQRQKAGLATTVELALARQAVAQAKLHVVERQGAERNTYLGLLNAVGVSPTVKLKVAKPEQRSLPDTIDPLTADIIQNALTQRPDLVAAYSAVKAAQAGITATEADFLPKVYLGAVAAHNRTSFDVVGLPGLSQTSTSHGVLLGVTLPIFDGGLRRARVQEARLRADDAKTLLENQQRNAVREIIAAETMLQTALQSTKTARELVDAAQTTYDAALSSYQEGVSTVTIAIEATSQLLTAQQAYADAQTASLIAAANLAFVMGDMTTPRSEWLSR